MGSLLQGIGAVLLACIAVLEYARRRVVRPVVRVVRRFHELERDLACTVARVERLEHDRKG